MQGKSVKMPKTLAAGDKNYVPTEHWPTAHI
jgi:hypothetical protein